MEMISVAGYLPDSVKKSKHKTAINMEKMVRVMAESNEGTLSSFEVSKPGTALLLVIGDVARQAIIREFKRLENVVVAEVPALTVQMEKNQKEQERANKMREAFKKRVSR